MIDFTSWWALVQRRPRLIGQVVLGLLIFAVGWQTGRLMSPYYAAHPIVFQDRPCLADNCTSSGGSQAELQQLLQEGTRQPQATAAAASAAPTVAGAASDSNQTAAAEKMFVGSLNSNKYHFPDCPSAKRIKEENKIWFSSQAEAEAAGYVPSACAAQRLGF